MAVIEVNNSNFENEVIKSDVPVLVDFNADWCGPCQMLKPIIEELSEERNDIKFVSVNVDQEELLSEKYSVYSIPCLILFEDGKEVKRNVGFKRRDDITELLGEK